MARTLVVVEALVGQIVLVALVARLVGMQSGAAPRAVDQGARSVGIPE